MKHYNNNEEIDNSSGHDGGGASGSNTVGKTVMNRLNKSKQMYMSYSEEVTNNFKIHSQHVSLMIFLCVVFICLATFFDYKKLYFRIIETISIVLSLYNIWLQFVISKNLNVSTINA